MKKSCVPLHQSVDVCWLFVVVCCRCKCQTRSETLTLNCKTFSANGTQVHPYPCFKETNISSNPQQFHCSICFCVLIVAWFVFFGCVVIVCYLLFGVIACCLLQDHEPITPPYSSKIVSTSLAASKQNSHSKLTPGIEIPSCPR